VRKKLKPSIKVCRKLQNSKYKFYMERDKIIKLKEPDLKEELNMEGE